MGAVHRGWARSASGSPAEGISYIEDGIRDYPANGTIFGLPFLLAIKAEALYLSNRIPEALTAIEEADAVIAKNDLHYMSAELHRLRGVLLTAIGADETCIEASFRTAISTAKEQKSVSVAKHAEATYAEYHRQKARGSGGHGFRLPLW